MLGKRIDRMLFPGGKAKALTLSYDDGVVQDRRLLDILNAYGLKGTFNLNSAVLGWQGRRAFPNGREADISKVAPEEVRELYRGQEIGGHGLCHSSPQDLGPRALLEIIDDRRALEELSGGFVRFFAYPFGAFDDKTKAALDLAGYLGARTVRSTHSFDIPRDFLEWDPTCHHGDPELKELWRRFLEIPGFFGARLFYLWGHAYEFDADDNWQVIEDFAKAAAPHADSVWFAGNAAVADYVIQYRRRVYSADGHLVMNPTATELWMQVGRETIALPAGATVELPEPEL